MYFSIFVIVFIIICCVLFAFDDKIPNKEQRRKRKEEKLLDKSRTVSARIHMREDDIEYFLKEMMKIWRNVDIRSTNNETPIDSLSIYTDDELDNLRLYSYSIYKFAIQIFNLNMKHKKK